jgi:3-hydroxybutyryl-CoA dehydrogenase
MSRFDLGIVGAGVMGTGIAQSAVEAGLDVLLVDERQEALVAAQTNVQRGLRLARMLGHSPATASGKLELGLDLDAVAAAAFVIESVRERIDVKERVFSALDRLCPAEICLASNTSAIPIARMAACTRRPARVLGIHFMNPAPRKDTVELVRAPATGEEAMATARALLARLGKHFVEVADGPGFVSNRVLMLAVNEAIAAAAEGKAPPAEIDRLFTACLGHKMGPLATADLIGLDVILDTLNVLVALVGPKYQPHPLLAEKVARGELGLKSGQGFFTHPSP